MPCQAAFFRGDAPHLLDRLVESCQQKPSSPHAGYGRDLTPVGADWLMGADCGPLSGALEAPRGYAKGGRSPEHKKRAAAPGSPSRRRSGDAPAAPPAGGYACPSFSAAPKPEALPMPTSSLMTRALCRRSPSPPKYNMPTAHHVAVMA